MADQQGCCELSAHKQGLVGRPASFFVADGALMLTNSVPSLLWFWKAGLVDTLRGCHPGVRHWCPHGCRHLPALDGHLLRLDRTRALPSIIGGDRALCRVLEFAEEFGISVSYDPLMLCERRGGY